MKKKNLRRLVAGLTLATAAVTGIAIEQTTATPQHDTTWGASTVQPTDTTWGLPPADGGTITPLDTTWG